LAKPKFLNMKNILISGGTGGIGEEVCRFFSGKGYRVIFFYNKNLSKANSLQEECNAIPYQVDITNEQGVLLAINNVKKLYGKISAVINCAGISKRGLFQDFTSCDFDEIFAVNVKGIFNVCKPLIWDLIDTKGDIINISSIWASVPASCEVLYSASKGAVESLTKSLAEELSLSGVKVNAISPGFVDTAMNKGLTKEDIEDFLSSNDLKRVVSAQEIAMLCEEIILGKETGKIFEIFGR